MAACPRCQDGDAGDPLCDDCAPTSPGATLERTLEAWSDHLPTLLLFWAVPAAAATVARAGVLVLHGDAFAAYADGLQQVLEGADPAVLAGPAGTLAPWLAFDAAVTAVFFGAIRPVAAGIARGEDPGPLPGLRAAAGRLLPLLVTGALVGAAVLAGFLLLMVPGLVALHWFLLALPAAGDGASPGEALRRSRGLVREHGSLAFPAFAVAVWLAADTLAAGAGDLAASAAGLAPQGLPAVLATGIAQWILAPVFPLFVATYHVHLEAAGRRSRRRDPEPGAAGEPGDEVVVGRCPDCGAYVPDDRTEPDVDPTCPTCGRTGPLEQTG